MLEHKGELSLESLKNKDLQISQTLLRCNIDLVLVKIAINQTSNFSLFINYLNELRLRR